MSAITTARLFKNGSSQAVRLPKEYRFEGEEVAIRRMGDAVVLLPLRYRKDDLLSLLADIGPVELAPREQGDWSDKRA
ncbi:MAG: AbrB/MazE/SpoVT family DNA-binding domain-containing protein [Sulfuritalea sp.]|nr:AbrB/MazE/SpoVT family DNA-binding domain-containing protein [Sulfuritalea sp.]